MCEYPMLALSETSRARGVWLLCGPFLFGDNMSSYVVLET